MSNAHHAATVLPFPAAGRIRREHTLRVAADAARLLQAAVADGNLREGPFADTCEMILLYPTASESLSAAYKFNDHKIDIRTVNLDQPWQRVHDDLLALVA